MLAYTYNNSYHTHMYTENVLLVGTSTIIIRRDSVIIQLSLTTIMEQSGKC